VAIGVSAVSIRSTHGDRTGGKWSAPVPRTAGLAVISSYKFALARKLLATADRADDRVSLADLAGPATPAPETRMDVHKSASSIVEC
jgi:hypothetical protein